MEWILFGIGVAVIGVIGIVIGLAVGRAFANRAARRSGEGGDSFMTPVGPPADEAAAGGADDAGSGDGADGVDAGSDGAGRGDGA